MDNKLQIYIKALLDSSGIGKSDIIKIQENINKYTLNVKTDLKKTQLLKSVKEIVPQLEAEIKKVTGINIKIDNKILLQTIKQMTQETEKSTAAQNKLNNAMARCREQSELSYKAEEKRQQLIQNNSINKSLEQEYEQREKILSSVRQYVQELSAANAVNIESKGEESKTEVSASDDSGFLKSVVDSGAKGIQTFNVLNGALTTSGALFRNIASSKMGIGSIIQNLDWLICRAATKIA